ncbi:MAG TPA: enoyl-CoA hydratase/isomerase family protein [Pseudonocardia sp.]
MSRYESGPPKLDEYGSRYPNLRMERGDGVLQLTMHDGAGGRMVFGGDPHPHGQLTEAFADIARDPENRVVILTGAGGAFIESIVFGDTPGKLPATAFVGMDTESVRFLLNQVSVPVPMIAAVDGPAHVHAELALLCDIAIASPTAEFQDVPHYPAGLVPGDGAHVIWPLFLGPGRARYFLLTGQKIGAEQALELGLVQEVVPAERLIDRAWELARQIAAQPPMTARYTRALFTQDIKRRLVDDLPFGLTAEILAATESFPSGVRQ